MIDGSLESEATISVLLSLWFIVVGSVFRAYGSGNSGKDLNNLVALVCEIRADLNKKDMHR